MVGPPIRNSGQYPLGEHLESRTQGMPRRDIFQSARSDSPAFTSFYVVESVHGIRLLDPRSAVGGYQSGLYAFDACKILVALSNIRCSRAV